MKRSIIVVVLGIAIAALLTIDTRAQAQEPAQRRSTW